MTQAGIVGLPGDVGSEKAMAGDVPRTTARHRSSGEWPAAAVTPMPVTTMVRSLTMDRELLAVHCARFGERTDSRQHGVGDGAEMVDQKGLRLAGMTADDREELAEEVVTAARWRCAPITSSSGTGSPMWIVNVMRGPAAIRHGMMMAPVAAASRKRPVDISNARPSRCTRIDRWYRPSAVMIRILPARRWSCMERSWVRSKTLGPSEHPVTALSPSI